MKDIISFSIFQAICDCEVANGCVQKTFAQVSACKLQCQSWLGDYARDSVLTSGGNETARIQKQREMVECFDVPNARKKGMEHS